jgi:hypothetical protein
MSDDWMNLEVLARVPTEVEAAVIVGELESRGIRAEAVGGYTATFRAEAPGDVKVLVRSGDLVQAKAVLEEMRQSEGRTDWSNVDVGDED